MITLKKIKKICDELGLKWNFSNDADGFNKIELWYNFKMPNGYYLDLNVRERNDWFRIGVFKDCDKAENEDEYKYKTLRCLCSIMFIPPQYGTEIRNWMSFAGEYDWFLSFRAEKRIKRCIELLNGLTLAIKKLRIEDAKRKMEEDFD
jgi:hypothetical protein